MDAVHGGSHSTFTTQQQQQQQEGTPAKSWLQSGLDLVAGKLKQAVTSTQST
jgi:hypothetical protein